jgi:hypothetical protein
LVSNEWVVSIRPLLLHHVNPDVGEEMLKENPVAVITPFADSRVRLPKVSDLGRLPVGIARF